MAVKRFIIYCDESVEKGKFYSHFYGGALIEERNQKEIEERLRQRKADLNLFKELKWTKITESYKQKYIDFIDTYFDLIEEGAIKIRIMFIQNIYKATGLQEYQIDNEYFMLYYQMIKHAFGLRYSNPDNDNVYVRLFLDDIPGSPEKFKSFKEYISSLSKYPIFSRAGINIPYDDIAEVSSKEHVILQGLDIILGSMQFRLNEKHKEKPKGKFRRLKRTVAKEEVYKHINTRIRRLYPNFNIGISTGRDDVADKWHHPYRHWSFIPSDHEVDLTKGKKYGPA